MKSLTESKTLTQIAIVSGITAICFILLWVVMGPLLLWGINGETWDFRKLLISSFPFLVFIAPSAIIFIGVMIPLTRKRAYYLARPKPDRLQERAYQKVHEVWIKRYLRNIDSHLIELSFRENETARGDDVKLLDQLMHAVNQKPALLILTGHDGGGKTTAALQLCDQLIQSRKRAPLYYQLSTWEPTKQSFEKWLINLGCWEYGFNKREMNQLLTGTIPALFLFDGLDEMHARDRSTALKEVDRFQAEKHRAVLVTCDKNIFQTINYQTRGAHLFELSPLSDQQIDTYIRQYDVNHTGISAHLRSNPESRKMAQTPLFLHLLVLLYRNQTVHAIDLDLGTHSNYKEKAAHLIALHIDFLQRVHQRPDSDTRQRDVVPVLKAVASSMTRWGDHQFSSQFLYQGWLLGPNYHRPRRSLIGPFWGLVLGFLEVFSVGFFVALVFGFFLIPLPESWIEWMGENRFGWINWVKGALAYFLAGIGAYLFSLATSPFKYDPKPAGNVTMVMGLVGGFVGLLVGDAVGMLPWVFFADYSARLFSGLGSGMLFYYMTVNKPFPNRIISSIYSSRGHLQEHWPLSIVEWNRFFEECEQQKLLYKIGDSWIFPHRLYRDYLAKQYQLEGMNDNSPPT